MSSLFLTLSVIQTLCGIQLFGARLGGKIGVTMSLGIEAWGGNWHKGCLFHSMSLEMGVLLGHVERFAWGQKTGRCFGV